MIIGRIQGCNAEIAKDQPQYQTLPSRISVVVNSDTGAPLYQQFDSAWLATPEEIQAIVEGKPIVLRVITSVGAQHPPVMIFAGDPMEGKYNES